MLEFCDHGDWRFIVPLTSMGVNLFADRIDILNRSMESFDAFEACIWISKALSFSVGVLFLLYVACQVAVFLFQCARAQYKSQADVCFVYVY
jgi:hypothetical protein